MEHPQHIRALEAFEIWEKKGNKIYRFLDLSP